MILSTLSFLSLLFRCSGDRRDVCDAKGGIVDDMVGNGNIREIHRRVVGNPAENLILRLLVKGLAKFV